MNSLAPILLTLIFFIILSYVNYVVFVEQCDEEDRESRQIQYTLIFFTIILFFVLVSNILGDGVEIILLIAVSSLFLWVFFVNVIVLRDRYLDNPGNMALHYLVYGSGAIFVVYDFVFNVFIGSIIFLQLPTAGKWTLTSRLKDILRTENKTAWRYKFASWICHRLIEPHDPGHCSIV